MNFIEELAKQYYSEEDTKEYNEFVEKHKPKRTKDDCYTPPEVYEAVKDWVLEKCPQVRGLKVMRPFYPGGDYQSEDYTGAVVIDNPPFSILSEIKRFYLSRKIPFFIFATGLTLIGNEFNDFKEVNYIISDCDIVYQNGAIIRTSFISNLFGDNTIIITPEIKQRVNKAQREARKGKNDLPKYTYPANVVTSALLQKYPARGVEFNFKRHQLAYVRQLDSQKPHKKSLYGYGFFISDHALEAFKEAQEKAEKIEEEEGVSVEFALSTREKEIIKELNKRG